MFSSSPFPSCVSARVGLTLRKLGFPLDAGEREDFIVVIAADRFRLVLAYRRHRQSRGGVIRVTPQNLVDLADTLRTP